GGVRFAAAGQAVRRGGAGGSDRGTPERVSERQGSGGHLNAGVRFSVPVGFLHGSLSGVSRRPYRGVAGCPRRRDDGERSAAWSRADRRQGKAFPSGQEKSSAGGARRRTLDPKLGPIKLDHASASPARSSTNACP